MNRWTRKWHLAVLLAVLVLGVAACGGGDDEDEAGPEPAPTEETPPSGEWSLAEAAEPYRGAKLRILDEVTDLQASVAELIPQFEQETGIEVDYQLEGHLDVIRKGESDLFTGRGAFDAVMIHSVQLGRALAAESILFLDEFLDDPELKDPNVNFDDFLQPLTDEATTFGDQRVAFPNWNYNQIYWIRKDLLENPEEQKAFEEEFGYPLAVPETLEQMRDIAEFFTRDAREKLGGKTLDRAFAGFVMEGARQGAAFYGFYYNFVRQFGGQLFDEQGQPTLNTPEVVDALRFYADMWRFAPDGQGEFSLIDIPVVMGEGRAASGLVFSDFIWSIDRPGGSKFAGNIVYGPVPAGPGEHVAASEPSFLIINRASENPEATFLFLQWLASKETQDAWFDLGRGVDPVRQDSFQHPLATSGERGNLMEAIEGSLAVAERWPISDKLLEIADALNLHQQAVGLGQETPEEGAAALQSEVEDICDESCVLEP